MKVFIQDEHHVELSYAWSVFAQNKGIEFSLINQSDAADVKISSESDADIRISTNFYKLIEEGKLAHTVHFKNDCFIRTESGDIDYLSTAFYMINSLQEFNHNHNDSIGRFPYADSYQYKFKNVENNLVQKLFDDLHKSQPKLKGVSKDKRSRVFLSHDIDTVHGALLEDSFSALKKGRIDLMAGIIFRNIFMNPAWLNMDRIMKIESEHDFKSTFYWLVTNKKSSIGVKNADYNYSGNKIQKKVKRVRGKGWENGLHKSISEMSFEEEIAKLMFQPKGNRFHYLRFQAQHDFERIEKANILFDTSLGFAEAMGFRNSYGLPFRPFNLKTKSTYNFIECPLNIMDTTFHHYKKISAETMVKEVMNFFERNNENCVISVLFHNSYITDYKFKDFNQAFKKLLSYFNDSKFGCITQSQIIEKYRFC